MFGLPLFWRGNEGEALCMHLNLPDIAKALELMLNDEL
jgi:hypothetical protein